MLRFKEGSFKKVWREFLRSLESSGIMLVNLKKGVRGLRLVNIDLLAKWRCRLITSASYIWREILIAKYGASVVSTLRGGRTSCLWWKCATFLGSKEDDHSD